MKVRRQESLRRLLPLLHPLLFALFPTISLATRFAEATPPTEAWRVAVGLCLTAVGLGVAATRLTGHAGKGAAIASLAFVFFFSYRPVMDNLGMLFALPGIPQQATLVVGILWLGLAVMTISVILRTRGWPVVADQVFMAIGLSAVLLSGYQLTSYEALRRQPGISLSPRQCDINFRGHTLEQSPDIYYIVLDGYARSDILSSLYGTANEPFLSFLESRGFYIARESRANYVQTRLSIAATLSMDYLDKTLQQAQRRGIRWDIQVSRMVQANSVRRALGNLGYKWIGFG